MPDSKPYGLVYLIGAGPGDPGLITVKGQACIGKADVIVYDYLAAPSLLKYARKDAECIYVGKKGADHTLSQDGINALIVAKAKTGFSVARLKGGDPFIFGRGGEEAEALIAAGIAFEVVPGVTSAIAGPAYAGIPLTHRQFTSTVAFVTGHEDPGKEESAIDWKSLAGGIGTLVFFMGVKNLPRIVGQLIDCGKPADTPTAVIQWGTTARQKTVTGTLGTIEAAVRSAGIQAPALIVVGKVVELRKTMQWFDRRPLLGKRVVVTRAREQASVLVQQLEDLGAECLEIPTIQTVPPDDWSKLDQAFVQLGSYAWIIFTSVNGVNYFFERLFQSGLDARALGSLKTATIGPATEKRLLEFGIRSDKVPATYQAEALIAAFAGEDLTGRKILLPRALAARAILPEQLTRMGAVVNEVAVYQTLAVDSGADRLLSELTAGQIDLVTFTSSSTVTHFKRLIPDAQFDSLLKNVTIASIGPITSDTARHLGFSVHISAAEYTISGLCQAIVEHCRNG
jgi:uroporphyrinogen III methyltransferase/synthase